MNSITEDNPIAGVYPLHPKVMPERKSQVRVAPALRSRRDGSKETRQSFGDRLVALSVLGDTIVVFSCILFSYWLRFETILATVGVIPEAITFARYLPYILMAGSSLLCAFALYGCYDVLKLLRLRQVGLVIVKATTQWFLVFLSFTLIFKFAPPISRVFVIISAVTVFFAMIVWRYCFHRALQNGSAARNLRQRILFVGWNDAAARLSVSVMQGAHPSHIVAGYVHHREASPSSIEVPDLGGLEDVPALLHEHDIDVVILSAFDLKNKDVMWLANLCEREMRQFKVIPSFFPILVSGLRLESISETPVLGVTRLPLDHLHHRFLKRSIDIVGAFVGLIFFAPVILFFCAAVYRESAGPTIYSQWRIGRNGRRFRIFKIRSMCLAAESSDRAGWTKANDSRRLQIGKFMREWNIDELPQLWNVLKGEMSLVGPRPERPELIENFKFDVPHYNARHNVKAGMTGWAQVQGLRGDTDLAERIKSDLFYLEHWSLLLDLQIFVMTFVARKNAY